MTTCPFASKGDCSLFPDSSRLEMVAERRDHHHRRNIRPHRELRVHPGHAAAKVEELLQSAAHRSLRIRQRLHRLQPAELRPDLRHQAP